MLKSRTCALILVLVFSISMVFAGCGTSTKDGGNTGTTAAATEATTKADVIPEISIATTDSRDYGIIDGTPVQLYLEDKYKVKFKIVRIPADQRAAKIGLLVAANDMPDVLKVNGGSGADPSDLSFIGLFAQNAIGEIKKEDIQKYAPKSYAAIEQMAKDYKYDPYFATTMTDGKNYGLPAPWVTGRTPDYTYVRVWRLDLLKGLGFNEAPKTIADMEAIGAAQKAKNSKVYMMSGTGKDAYNQVFTDIYGAYGYDLDRWVYKDGKIQYTSIMPETKEAVALIASWYKKGYVDPEWLTTGWDDAYKMIQTGDVLSFSWGHMNYAVPSTTIENAYKLAKNINPNAEIVASPWVKGPSGKAGWPGASPYNSKGGKVFSKAMAADPVKVQKYLEMVDGYNFDDDTYLTVKYGIKGTHWNLDPEKGPTYVDEKYGKQEEQVHVGNAGYFDFAFDLTDVIVPMQKKYEPKWLQEWRAIDKAFAGKFPDVFNLDNMYAGADITPTPIELKNATTQIQTLPREYIDAIILGSKPISAFDEMVQKWLDGGGQKLLDFRNKEDLKYFK
ncbi:MAG: hypothetical protein FIA99_16610 [Ruminiclostridium sp.]|nr:hypothetical protein [Ruminiclostridium sp.]